MPLCRVTRTPAVLHSERHVKTSPSTSGGRLWTLRWAIAVRRLGDAGPNECAIDSQEASNPQSRPAFDLSCPDLVLDGGQLDDPRIEDRDGLAPQFEGALTGCEQVAAPIGVVAVRQRDDEAACDRLGGERRHVQSTALATDVMKGCGWVVRAPGPAQRH